MERAGAKQQETIEAEPIRKVKPFKRPPFVRDVARGFQALAPFQLQAVNPARLVSRNLRRRYPLEQSVDAKTDRIAAVGHELEVLFEVGIANIGRNPEAQVLAPDIDIIVKIAVHQGSVGKQAVAEDVVPADGCCRVAPVKVKQV